MKRAGIILTLTLLLVAMTLHANAMPQLRLGSVNAIQGQTATLNLSLSGGEEPYAGINAKILLPEGVTFTGVSKGALLPAGFTTDWHSVSNGVDNWATVIAYSGTDTFSSSSGTLLEIEVHIASDAPLGSHAVRFASSSFGLSNEDGSVSVTHTTSNGTINCMDPDGDYDGDGLSGSEELSLGTNPFDPDTDGDNCSDGYEYYAGTDPNDFTDFPLAVVIFVDDESGDDVNDGLDFRYATKTIQAGIDAAVDGQVVVVRDGIYAAIGNKNLNFSGKAITVRSQKGTKNTVIDCENDGRGFYFNHNETSLSVVEGFTITNGHDDETGGGMYMQNASPTIIDCIFSGNSAIYGGAIHCTSSSPTIANCTISGNQASYGGGIGCWSDSSPAITNCTISDNTATEGWGGGIFLSASSPDITDCIIRNNTAVQSGGIECTDGSSPTISACTIKGNQASNLGGGIRCYRGAFPVISNCIITANHAPIGGGIVCQDYAEPFFVNCTIADNEADSYGGGIVCHGYPSWPTLTNCILWGNAPDEVACGTADITYSDIDQEGYEGIDGNIRLDPLFAGNGNYHLTVDSPCIDAGSGEGAPVDDIDGEIRSDGADIDMGADEYIDSDSDNIPDYWEYKWFGNLSCNDGTDDPDFDGH